MKKLALAAALSVAASPAFAGSMEEPMMEPEIVIEETAASSGTGLLVPLMLILRFRSGPPFLFPGVDDHRPWILVGYLVSNWPSIVESRSRSAPMPIAA